MTMLSLKNFIRKLKSPYYYNVGFVDISPTEFINNRGFSRRSISWLKHDYPDRWYADPFILSANEDHIVVLAEEKEYEKVGRLVKLVVSRKTKELITRSVILELPTHLSYPIIINHYNKTYVYPENSQSGKLSIYEYGIDGKLKLVSSLINQPLNDSTIFKNPSDGEYYLIATHTNINPHNEALLYKFDAFSGRWSQFSETPIIKDSRYARPGGDFFRVRDSIYRPAQDCNGTYGNSLHIMKIESVDPWKEYEVFQLRPNSFRYSKGLHTLNFHESGIAVIDGNGYAYPLLGRLLGPFLERIIHH